MPIQPPSLADRSFDDLVEEVLQRIPAHTPEWTNPRLGDPGRTLVELFAWLTDTLLYRANLIPERQRLAFMALLGMPLRPAASARGLVSLKLPRDDVTGAVYLRASASIKDPVAFETLSELTVLPISAEAYCKRKVPEAKRSKDIDRLIDGLRSVYNIRGGDQVSPYITTPVFAGEAQEKQGFHLVAHTVDASLWLALLAPKAPQQPDQPALNTAIRSTLGKSATGGQQLISIGIAPLIAVPALFEEVGPRARIPHAWEMSFVNDDGLPDYITLQIVNDTSAGLTRNGVVRLALPEERFIQAPSNDVATNLEAGVGDAPPRLDAPDKAARLISWLRLRPLAGEEPLAQLNLSWVGINAVEIDQRTTFGPRVLGISTGGADQVIQLPVRSVEPETLQIEVEESGRGYQPWRRVEDLLAIDRDPTKAREARVYVLDSEAGTLRFGDGVRGRIPEAGMRVRVRRMRAGGGRAGNLPPGALTELTGSDQANARVALKVGQALATEGGEDAEDLSAAEKRIPSLLRHRSRAVTSGDYRTLALETPGVDIGRVELMPRFKPQQRRFDVPGVVSVVVLPNAPTGSLPNPRPDRPMIEAVHAYLDARRPLATELYVIGCEYIALSLSIAISLRDGFGQDTVLNDVRTALRRFLWPLAPGGIDAQGWPLGRSVRDRELEVEVARVPGVASVGGINLFESGVSGWRLLPRPNDCAPQELALKPWQLPELHEIVVVVGSSAPSEIRRRATAGSGGIAIPLVPELC